jgi:hypothetical protein
MLQSRPYGAIFAPASRPERNRAFEAYWAYLLIRDGALQEEAQSLEHKTNYYQGLQTRPLRTRLPLTPAKTMAELSHLLATQSSSDHDRRLLVLTLVYKFASHEAAGIREAWRATPCWEDCRNLTDRITRYHLCEEFCHLRLFAEMFKVCFLDVEWPSLSWPLRTAYRGFAHCPDWLLAPIAFGSEVMGMIFYRHLWRLLDEVFATDPEVLARLHELLAEIMDDELGNIGERRSFLGTAGVRFAREVLPMMMRQFFASIPEATMLLDVERMVHEALAFDYSGIDAGITARAWIPTYCQV